MAEFTKEQLIAEVHYNLEHCFCSEKTKRLMEIALAALTAEPEGGAHFARFDEEDDQIIDQCSKNQPDSFPLYRLPLLEGLK